MSELTEKASGNSPIGSEVAESDGHDDYALRRVPRSVRYSWVSVALQRFGQISSFHQFLLGATLGFGMNFWDAFLAFTIGSVMLEVITILIGTVGVREGLSTSVLARWTGFGRKGSALIGLLMTVSLTGWFGVQNAAFAEGLETLIGVLPFWAWALVGGVVVTAIVVYGFHAMAWTAYITVPAFIAVALYAVISKLKDHSLTELLNSPHPGPTMSLAAGTTLVSGAFIIGAIMTPDMTRFNRSTADVVKQTLVGVTLGQYLIGMCGVLLAHAFATDNPVGIITEAAGVFGVFITIAAILKINDWNLYSSGLGLVNTIEVLFNKRFSRMYATILLGVFGSGLSAIGIMNHFEAFLIGIGIITPPAAGIIIAEYFVVKRWRAVLDATREAGTLPDQAPDWVPSSLVCWVGGALVGWYVDWGFPAINSIVAAFLLYVVIGSVMKSRSTTTA